LTVEFKINNFKPAIGNKLFCDFQVINAGKRIITSESEIYIVFSGKNTLISKAMITIMGVPEEMLNQNRKN